VTPQDSEAAAQIQSPVTSEFDSSYRHSASQPSMTNSEPSTHLDLADPVYPAHWPQLAIHLARKIMSATLLYPVVKNCTPTRQVLRRTEFLGSLAISYVLIMIVVACPTSRLA
jgi:hypothetical protein